MLEPIRPGDDLFPFAFKEIEGKRRAYRREDWDDFKKVELNIRSIDYLLQFAEHQGSIGLMNMIEGYAEVASRIGTDKQKKRFNELLSLREQWLCDPIAAA